jgi:hypothetical protein
MKWLKTVTAVTLGLTLAACQDLDITNPNQPDRRRAVSNPNDVEALISGSYATIFRVTQLYNPAHALSMAADEGTSSYGNWAWMDISKEPREQWNNDASYTYAEANRVPWQSLYSAISSVNEGLAAINDGIEIGGGAGTPRAMAFGKFNQGVAYGLLGLVFDSAAIVDETTPAELQPHSAYGEVLDAAIGYLDEAIAIATANEFTIPESWMSVSGMNSAEFIKLANSYKVRFMVYGARSVAENAATDWDMVKTLVDAGITEDFAPLGNDEPFWTGMKYYLGLASWTRVDNHIHGPADTSGNYQAWLNTPLLSRNQFVNHTPDKRMPQQSTLVLSVANLGAQGKYFAYAGGSPFPADRGTYHYSFYSYLRDWRAAYEGNSAWYYLSPIPVMRKSEMDLIKAEAEMRATVPNAVAAADLVNITRVGNGELPPATALGAPGPQDGPGECVPKRLRDPSGACADLLHTIMYEKRFENYALDAGIAFFDARRWGMLASGTLIHFPIPGRELQILGLPIYTFGGGGAGSAP